MYYFAYGSNMDWGQMQQRCPLAVYICNAKLQGYELAFTRFSIDRQCGVSDIIVNPNRCVWGIIYDIDPNDIAELDRREGVHTGAYRRVVDITVTTNENPERDLIVFTYEVVQKAPHPVRSNQQYKDLICNGARHRGLPADYITNVLDNILV